MGTYQDETYGDRIADVYDKLYATVDPAMIQRLNELAAGGSALELGIGTGRVALPLQASGVNVVGIDASEAMVAKLGAKDGGGLIPVHRDSFASFDLDQRFSLIYVVFNTFFALLSQQDQVDCFRSVARHLEVNGAFVIEAFVPDLTRFDRGQRLAAMNMDVDGLQLDASRLDRASQQVSSMHVLIEPAGIRMYPVKLRYAWPAELDLMAEIAGMKLRERWGSWSREPYDAKSERHISIYGPAGISSSQPDSEEHGGR